MRSVLKMCAPLLLAVALACPMVITSGCGDQTEAAQYSQWEHDTHRDHQDLNKRNDADKKEYASWRQNQPNHH
jgi:hypothetical protein